MNDLTSRQLQILAVAETSPSCAEAGRRLGVSREYVRQVAGPRLTPDGMETLEEAAPRLGYAHTTLCKMAEVGVLTAMKARGRWYIPKGVELVLGYCELCGKPIGKGRRMYCSEECHVVGEKLSHKRTAWRRLHLKKGQRITERFEVKDKCETQRICRY